MITLLTFKIVLGWSAQLSAAIVNTFGARRVQPKDFGFFKRTPQGVLEDNVLIFSVVWCLVARRTVRDHP